MLQIRLAICLQLSLALGCNSAPLSAEQPTTAKQWCVVAEDKLIELSGIAPHRGSEETLLWAHNDGTEKKLYLIDSDGDTRATLDIDGIDPVDCEELCSFAHGERRYLLLADTGDNNLRRKSYQLFIVPEPDLEQPEDGGKKKKKRAAAN